MSAPTIISAQSAISGDVVSTSWVYVEGKVIGNIRCECLVVRKGGVVQGDVISNNAIVDGRVLGSVITNHLHVKKHSVVEGRMTYTKITIEHGAQITGQLSVEQNPIKDVTMDKSGYIEQDV